MKVLVTAASRHGATAEIAAAIGEALGEAGLVVTVKAPDEVTSLAGFDAVVLGSGVYLGRWMDPARHLVERLGAELAGRPVWLFSSGPLGEPPAPVEEAADLPDVAAEIGARGTRTFAGSIDRDRLGLGEKVILAAVRAPAGDYRPWDEIRAWAAEIAAALGAG